MKTLRKLICCALLLCAATSSQALDIYLTTNSVHSANGWPGTTNAPFFVANAVEYTDIIVTNNANCNFYYQAGIYETYGWGSGDQGTVKRQTANPNCKHFGTDDVVIRLIGATTKQHDGVIFGLNLYEGGINEATFADGFELHNLILDCNAPNQPKFVTLQEGSVTAVRMCGSDLQFSNLVITNFGSKLGIECFPFFFGTVDGYTPKTNFANVLVEGCTWTQPASGNTDGLTCIAMSPDRNHTLSNAVVTNCSVINVRSDFVYSHGFSVPLLVNSSVNGCEKGFYLEPSTSHHADYGISWEVVGNTFTNIDIGVSIIPTTPTNTIVSVGSIGVISNTIAVNPGPYNWPVWIYHPAATIGQCVLPFVRIENNLLSTNRPTSEYDGAIAIGHFSYADALIITNALISGNTIEIQNTNRALKFDSDPIQFLSAVNNRDIDGALYPVSAESGIIGTQQKSDLNLDTHTDILWRNYSTGSNYVWYMNGTNFVSGEFLLGRGNVNWEVGGTADFTGDCNNDVAWKLAGATNTTFWFMQSTNVTELATNRQANVNLYMAGTGDFNYDGKADIVWRNYTTGSNVVWFMDGTNFIEAANFQGTTNLNWYLAGTGDFNQDGKDDLVWRNQATGTNSIWYMNGTNLISTANMDSRTVLDWEMQAIGDFNMDAKPDIVWRNMSTGANQIWLMDNTTRLDIVTLPTEPNLAWEIVGPK